jgi:hypothetical protein
VGLGRKESGEWSSIGGVDGLKKGVAHLGEVNPLVEFLQLFRASPQVCGVVMASSLLLKRVYGHLGRAELESSLLQMFWCKPMCMASQITADVM